MILERKRRKPKKKVKALVSRNKESYGSRHYPKGRILRVSAHVYNFFQQKQRKNESWDQLMRRLHNIAQRDGTEEKLFECWILPSTGETAKTKAKARGLAVKNGVLKGKDKLEEPIKVREVI